MMEQPVDLEFAKQLPKIELHAHLSGSISRECLHDIWLAKKNSRPDLDLDDPLAHLPTGTNDVNINNFFSIFGNYIYRLINTIPTIRESTLRVLADFEADNVCYLELRTTPRAIPEFSISKQTYVETVLCAIEDYHSSKAHKMLTKVILAVDRRNTAAEATEVVELALQLQDRGVVGVDLCGDPKVVSIKHLMPVLHEATFRGLKLTLHFAEAESSASDEELRMLLNLEPDRLGHVICVKDEFKQEIIKKGIGLELCLSCNVQAEMIKGTYADHHFGEWNKVYKKIALCTDDVGIFQNSLSKEYYLAAQHFGLTRAELVDLAENVIDLIWEQKKGKDDIFPVRTQKYELRQIYKEFRESLPKPPAKDDAL